jgi:hypothetical protein
MTRNYVISISHLFKHVINITADGEEECKKKVRELLANNELTIENLEYEGTLSENRWKFIEKKDLYKQIIENRNDIQ